MVWHELTEVKRREAELRAQLELIRAQQAEIHRLSMPVIEVWDRVLMVPVLGALDRETAASLTTPVLAAIARTGARAIIVDLTGLTGADLPTAHHLARLLTATQLLGAEGMIVGINPAVAQAFIAAGAEFPRVRTLATLREALQRCLQTR